jgi:hypothetical protein
MFKQQVIVHFEKHARHPSHTIWWVASQELLSDLSQTQSCCVPSKEFGRLLASTMSAGLPSSRLFLQRLAGRLRDRLIKEQVRKSKVRQTFHEY